MTVAIPSTRAALVIGGRVFTDLENLIMVKQSGSFNASDVWMPCRKNGSSSSYAVTTGKTYNISAMRVLMASSHAGGFDFGYADDAGTPGSAQSAQPANSVSYHRWTVNFLRVIGLPATAGDRIDDPLDFSVPAGKYVWVYGPAASVTFSTQFYGYEE